MLRWRLLLGTLLIALLVGLGWLDAGSPVPGAWLMPVAMVAVLLGGQEAFDLVAGSESRAAVWPIHVGNALLILAAWLPALWNRSAAPHLLAALFAAVCLIFLVGVRRYEAPDHSAHRLAPPLFAVVYVGYLLCFAVRLRMEFGVGPLASLLVIVKMGDIGAYTVGRLIGRRKMAAKISPGKTIEGAAGALLFAAAGSWASFMLMATYGGLPAAATEGIKSWLPFGLLIGLAGIFGDLAESLLKRDAGVKDSSRWLPGFGGVLDIIDSILLAAPLAWFCWEFWLKGL